MPKEQKRDLFDLIEGELSKSIRQASIVGLDTSKYPKQEEIFKSQARGRYVAGGNRAGKSDTEVIDAVWMALNTHPFRKRPDNWGQGPIQIRFVVVDIVKGVEGIILPKLKRWVPRSELVNQSWDQSWDPRTLRFTFANGSTIEFLTHGMELDKHGGKPLHIVYFDEEPPQDIFVENLMRLVDYRGWWLVAATSVGGITWTYDLIVEPAESGTLKDVETFTLKMTDNPYNDTRADELDFYFVGSTKEDREIREEGKFVARQGFIFPEFGISPEKFVLPQHYIPPKDWDWYSSVDFGFNNATAWLWHAVSPKGHIYTFAEHYASKLNVAQHAEIVKAREAEFGKSPQVRVGDPNNGTAQYGNTGTSYVAEYATRGIYIATEQIPRQVQIGLEKMQQYLQILDVSPWGRNLPTWRCSPNCVNLIREMKKLRYAAPESSRVAYRKNSEEIIQKKDDHSPDALRYFFTLMPSLIPLKSPDPLPTKENPQTISFQDMLARVAASPTESFVQDNELTKWTTQYEDEAWNELRYLT